MPHSSFSLPLPSVTGRLLTGAKEGCERRRWTDGNVLRSKMTYPAQFVEVLKRATNAQITTNISIQIRQRIYDWPQAYNCKIK